MIKFTCFILLGLSLSCSDRDELQINELEPKAMNTYCQRSPEEMLRRSEYEYENSKLKFVFDLRGETIYSKTTYAYDSDLLKKETFESEFMRSEKDYIYNQKDQLINVKLNVKSYDAEGDLESEQTYEAPLEYENDLLVKKWSLYGAYQTYEYENESLVTESFYSSVGSLQYVLHKKYQDGLIVEEKTIDANGLNLGVKKFFYDIRKKLISITSDGETVERNIYNGNRLIEKKTFYFGVDPGFDPCYGNYLYTYEY